jgi:ATP-binding cassette, subfamily B, bacterial
MASTSTAPGPDKEHASEQISGGPPPGVPPGIPPGAPAGAPTAGSVSSPMAAPPGVPAGGAIMDGAGVPAGGAVMDGAGGGMGGAPPPSMNAFPYVARSLSLLNAFRGSVTGLIVLGLIAALMPFVAGAGLGPLLQALPKDLRGVWGQHGAFNERPPGGTSGPLGWLAHPLSFQVLLILISGALILAQLLTFFRSWLDAQVEWKLVTNVRQRVHDHLQSLSLDFFTGARGGALMERVLFEAQGVQRLLNECVIPLFIDAVVLVFALLYAAALSWQMTIVTLILSPLALMTLRFVAKKVFEADLRTMMRNREVMGELEETISGISDIQVFNAEQHRSERFHESSGSFAKNFALMKIWMHASSEGTQIYVALSTALVLITGVAFSASFNLNFNSLVQFFTFVPLMYQPVSRIVGYYTTYRAISPNIVTTYQLLDTKPTVAERPDAEELGDVDGNIVLEDVVFGYSPDQRILDGLSFSVKKGETVALVGPIGSGKSTIFNLLLRFLDPQRGQIVLDGHDISRATLRSLRVQVSKLSQFPFFVKDTIRENVRMGRQDATDAEVEDACKVAHIHEEIIDPDKMADGYDTIVDVQVPSGGQKRLIALARCLLRKPEVLLLDEPTENLDTDQRVRVRRVIREYANDRTCVVISHDMDFIAAVSDRIVVLQNGRVAEEGTHAELLLAGGLYTIWHGSLESLAHAIHNRWRAEQLAADKPAPSWSELDESRRESNRAQARDIAVKLRAIGCDIEPIGERDEPEAPEFRFTSEEAEMLAIAEHDRWMDERKKSGWSLGDKDVEHKKTPYLVPFADLPDDIAEYDRMAVREIPTYLASVGIQIIRAGTS